MKQNRTNLVALCFILPILAFVMVGSFIINAQSKMPNEASVPINNEDAVTTGVLPGYALN